MREIRNAYQILVGNSVEKITSGSQDVDEIHFYGSMV
jgi:hypothetical protein